MTHDDESSMCIGLRMGLQTILPVNVYLICATASHSYHSLLPKNAERP